MISNVNIFSGARFQKHSKQAENSPKKENETTTLSTSDKIEISDEAKAASRNTHANLQTKNSAQVLSSDEPDKPLEELLAEYKNTGGTSRADATDDGSETEAKRKLTAMKIARRISKGDNVPMQDHRFLAEFDANLYKAALKASMVADNKDPEDHDSLADELAAEESAKALRDSQRTELDTDAAEETAAAPEFDDLV